MDIEAFRAQINKVGLTQGNRYTINIPHLDSGLSMLCVGVTLTMPRLESFSYQNAGFEINPVYNMKYTPLSTQWYCLENGEPYNTFMDLIQKPMSDEFVLLDFHSYANLEIVVTEYNRQGNQTMIYTYHNAYLSDLSGKTLSYENIGAVLKFDASWTFETMTKRASTSSTTLKSLKSSLLSTVKSQVEMAAIMHLA